MKRKYRTQRFYGWDRLLHMAGKERYPRMIVRNADRSAWVAASNYAKRHGIKLKLRFSSHATLVVDRVA